MKRTISILLALSLLGASALTSCTDDEIIDAALPLDSGYDEPTTEEEWVDPFEDLPEVSYPDLSGYDYPYIDEEETTEPEDTTESPEETTETASSTEATAVSETTTEAETEPETSAETTAVTTSKKKSEKKDKKKKIIDVPYISQKAYPTGCELVSTSMLLAYYGFETSAGDLVKDGCIDAVPLKKEGGKTVCADPNKAFIGDPASSKGYGCYSGAIFNCLEKYIGDDYYDCADLSGMSLDDLCMLYIDYGQPVLIWATIDMKPTEEKPENKWTIDGSDKEFQWLSNEHCMVLVGYDDENYYFNDPQRVAATAYKKDTAKKRYKELGCQAVTVHPW